MKKAIFQKVPLVGMVIFSLTGLFSARTSAHEIIVQPATRVSSVGAGPHFWYTIASSLSDPTKLIICGLRNRTDIEPGQSQAILYGSEDAGGNWRMLFADPTPAYTSEVSCAFGSGRTLYFVASNSLVGDIAPSRLLKGDENTLDHMHLRRSLDFGAHWQNAPLAGYSDSSVLITRPASSPDRDRVFIFADMNGERNLGGWLTVSTDGSRTFGNGAIPLTSPERNRAMQRTGEEGNVVSWADAAAWLPNGTLGLVSSDHPVARARNLKLYVTLNRVDANGKSLGTPIIIAPLAVGPEYSSMQAIQEYVAPSIAVGTVPHTGKHRVYVAWNDLVHSRVRVLLASSDDSGKTWASPHVVDDASLAIAQPRGLVTNHASIAVNAAGSVGLEWVEFYGRCWRFAASRDGGVTFSHSVPISPCSHSPLPIAENLSQYLVRGIADQGLNVHVSDFRAESETLQRGTGLAAASDGSFHAAWTAFGNADRALYSTRIDVDNAKLEAATARRRRFIFEALHRQPSGHTDAWLNYTRMSYDEGSGEFTIGVTLVQPKATSVGWPVILRAKGLYSERLGPLHAVNADNEISGKGAAWLFDGPDHHLPVASQAGQMQNLSLGPSREYSAPRILRFRLDDAGHRPHGSVNASLLDVNFDLLVPPK